MNLELFHDAILTVDLPNESLMAGDVGTIVEVHAASDREPGYSIEFFDMTGRAVAVVTLPASYLRAPTPADRPSVRVLANHD